MAEEPEVMKGILLEEEAAFSLGDLSEACSVNAEWIVLLVEEGIIEPIDGSDAVHWRFSGSCMYRVRTAQRLQHDLGLNLAGIALALELLDEIKTLRQRLDRI